MNKDQSTIMIARIDMLASNLHKELLAGGKNPLATSRYVVNQSSIFFFIRCGCIPPVTKGPTIYLKLKLNSNPKFNLSIDGREYIILQDNQNFVCGNFEPLYYVAQ